MESKTETKKKKVRIGMIVPSSNTVVEPVCMEVFYRLKEKASVHFARVEVTKVDTSKETERQFSQSIMLEAAKQLASAKVDCIVWSGTAASWRGIDRDIRLCEEIRKTTGIPATSSTLAIIHYCKQQGIGQIAAITPYIDEVNEQIITEYEKNEIKIVDLKAMKIIDNLEIGQISPERITDLCRQVTSKTAKGIAIICTNLDGTDAAKYHEAEINKVVIDSVLVAIREAFLLTGVTTESLKDWGQVMYIPDEGK